MNKKTILERVNYPILEWDVASFIEGCEVIMASSNYYIHMIKFNKSHEVYLVPQAFYLSARECLK